MAKNQFSPLFSQLLRARGLKTQKEITDFLHPDYEKVHDENLLPDMKKAVERIKKAILSGEKMMIFGDYDVDGVTATALLLDALGGLGAKNLSYDLPERMSDGYGLPTRVVEKIKRERIGLLITVDCGSSNAEIVRELKGLGVDVIITDHHDVTGELPDALAVINPKRKDSKYPFQSLSGVGVAFKLVLALQRQLDGLPCGQEKWLLDLVALGTICDQMELVDENRTYVFYGLKVLGKTRRAGLKALKEIVGVTEVSSFAVGFLLGPRINAAGRMSSPRLALELLIVKSRSEAMGLAKEVDELNTLRRKLQDEAMELVEKRQAKRSENVIFIHQPNWHEGVIGIIASKVVEKYHKPVFVLTGEDELKCSARSFGDFSVAEAIKNAKKMLIKGGGHAGAGGLTIKKEHFSALKKMTWEFHQSLALGNQEKFFDVYSDIETSELAPLNEAFLKELMLLAPFGEGNPEPVVLLRGVLVLDSRSMGAKNQHLRLTVRGKDGVILKLVAFCAPEAWFVRESETISAWVTLAENKWNGVTSVEARILRLQIDNEAT
ncbi:MAG: single-stranded-DNA-specific exonuclease RecJ [Candidatus Nomurabacteria bacterium]|jgi:single-stranded-DNA-specific exonuclease|nr:single-stranded-DNA-specific exonuclease RecJ [Candidatus Nomurabacteria bacterium]